MLRKTSCSIILILLFIAADISPRGVNSRTAGARYSDELILADSLYHSNQYNLAFNKFQTLSLKNIPDAKFKMAYAAFKAGHFSESAVQFEELYKSRRFLGPYSGYFYIESLWKTDPASAMQKTVNYISRYAKHVLSDSLLIPAADYLYEEKKYKSAANYYSQASKRFSGYELKVYSKIRHGKSLHLSGQKKSAEKKFAEVIRKYPRYRKTRELVSWLKENSKGFIDRNFFPVVKVYIRNRYYSRARSLLERYIKSNSDQAKIEKARFYLLTIYYNQGNYRTALYGFQKLEKSAHSTNLKDDIHLYTARCYRKIGRMQKAIDSYLAFAKKFPKYKKAPETVWKAAWLYESKNKLKTAAEVYSSLARRWPYSRYAGEARFREGFAYFKLGDLEKARNIFDKMRRKSRRDHDKNRAQYWCALCEDRLGNKSAASSLRLDIGRNLWDDFYTMRAYLLHKEELDTTLEVIKDFRLSSNPLLYFASGLSRTMADFEYALQVQELLGSGYAKIVIDSLKKSIRTLPEWIAVGELYKRFSLYGKAYKTYDFINRRYFKDLSYVEKAFMLKERFPLYYDEPVNLYSKRYGLEKELILGLMKQESLFKPTARSYANAHGLMQLIPATAQDMCRLAKIKYRSPEQLYDVDLNIHLGSLYLKLLAKRFNGRKEHMLAAYNAGPHRVKRWLKRPMSEQTDVFIEDIEYQETRNYVKLVLKNYWAYKILNSNFSVDSQKLLGYRE